MLEFIVLGQVPGTQIYLSFTLVTILFVVTSGIFVWNIKNQSSRLIGNKKSNQIEKESI
jgi:hypothetical protein